jgi:hypothetical protein
LTMVTAGIRRLGTQRARPAGPRGGDTPWEQGEAQTLLVKAVHDADWHAARQALHERRRTLLVVARLLRPRSAWPNARRRPSRRNGWICVRVLSGNRSKSAGGVPLGPPAGAARAGLQAAARVTWQAHATRWPCTCVGAAGGQGSDGEASGLPVWLSGVGGTGHGLRARVTPGSDAALLCSVQGSATGIANGLGGGVIPGPFAHSQVAQQT